MKVFVALVAILALIGSALALKNDICGLPHSADGDGLRSCAAYFPSWSFNSEAGECVDFIYGGCGGNANRFGSKEDCEAKCKE